jgi:HSP20 family molecular chaperone IbpA
MTQDSSRKPSETTSTDLNPVSARELLKHTQVMVDMVARRAFEIFESRGHLDGHDREDWFLAESELLRPVTFQVMESDDHLIAHAEIPGFFPHEIKVSIEPRRLKIGGRTGTSENRNDGKTVMHSLEYSLLPAKQIFHVAELPAEVDPSKAKATFTGGRLEIVMPKVASAKSRRVETKPTLSAEGDTSVQAGIEPAGSPPVATEAKRPNVKARVASSRR